MASLVALQLACSTAESGPDCDRIPIGQHQVHVGDSWQHPLSNTANKAHWQWQLTTAPEGLSLLMTDAGVELVWTPTAFDLGPNPPGTPRQHGPMRAVELRGEGGDHRCIVFKGGVQATPEELSPGIAGPGHVALDLALSRTGRWRFQSDTGALLGAPISLAAGAPANTELLPIGPGVYDLRFRPDREQLRQSTPYPITLEATAPGGAIASHIVSIELRNAHLASACGGHPPAVRMDLQPQVLSKRLGPTGLSVALTVTDVDSRAADWQLRWRQAEVDGEDATEAGPLQADRATANLPLKSGQLISLVASGRDVDDGMLGHCEGVGRWPLRGRALLGVGPGCTDEPNGGGEPILLPPGSGTDRRHCPGSPEALQTLQAAGQALAVIATVPPGWPPVRLQVSGSPMPCVVTGPQPACWLPAPAAARWVDLVLSSEAATSSHIEVRRIDESCPWQSAALAADVALPSATTVTIGLCPGERRVVALGQPEAGRETLLWAADRPHFEVEAMDQQGQVLARWRPAATLRIDAALGTAQQFAVSNPTAQRQSISVRWAQVGPAPSATPRWLPSLIDSVVGLDAHGTEVVALARNADSAASLEVDPPPPDADLTETMGAQAPPLFTAPWPDPTPWLLGTAQGGLWQAWVAADKPGTPALAIRSAVSRRTRLTVRPAIEALAKCEADRYQTSTIGAGVELLAPPSAPLILSQLRLCPGETDLFRLAATRDALLDVAVVAEGALPLLRVTAADGRTCLVESAGSKHAGLDARLLPLARRRASCWLGAAGEVTIEVVAADALATYDLAVRLR